MGAESGSCEDISHGSHRQTENGCGTRRSCVQAARKSKEKSELQQARLAQKPAF